MSRSTLLLALAGLVVGGALLALAFRDTPAAAVWAALRSGDWTWPALGALASTAAFVGIKAWRWHALLGAPAATGPRGLVAPVTAGLALNSLVPHSGEFYRAIAVREPLGLRASTVLASVFVERLFDFLGILLLGGVAAALVDAPPELAVALRLFAFAALGLGAIAVALVVRPDLVRRLVGALTAVLPARPGGWVRHQAEGVLEGLALARSGRALGRGLAGSVAIYAAVAACVWCCARVAGIPLGPEHAVLVVVGIVVAFTLPNAPAYAGATQFAFLAVLAPLGFDEARALAASLAYTVLMILPLLVAGLAMLRTGRRAGVSGT